MTDQYYDPNPPPSPQLSKADMKRMTPDQIVRADDAGQFAVVKQGRTPVDAERRGERWASADEIAEQRRDDRNRTNQARADVRANYRQEARSK